MEDAPNADCPNAPGCPNAPPPAVVPVAAAGCPKLDDPNADPAGLAPNALDPKAPPVVAAGVAAATGDWPKALVPNALPPAGAAAPNGLLAPNADDPNADAV